MSERTFDFAAGELDFLLTHVDELLIGVGESGRMSFVSPRAREVLGREPADLLGQRWLAIVAPDDRDRVSALGEGGHLTDVRVIGVNGSERTVALSATQLVDHPLGAFLLTIHPDPHSRDLEAELGRGLAEEERLTRVATMFVRLGSEKFEVGLTEALGELAALVEVDRVTVWRCDPESSTCTRAESWTASGGWSAPATGDPGDDVMARALAAGLDSDGEVEWSDDDRSAALLELPAAFVRVLGADAGFDGLVSFERLESGAPFRAQQRSIARAAEGILTEVFARRYTEGLLDLQARFDPLTGLANRWAAYEAIEEALRRMSEADTRSGRGIAVLLVDLDRFKVINDALGQAAGDALLTEASRRIVDETQSPAWQQAVGHADPRSLVARIGGDEILVMAEGVASAQAALGLAERVQSAFEDTFDLSGDRVVASVSVGVVHVTHSDWLPDELVRRADLAMYRAKDRGRSRVHLFDEELLRSARARLSRLTDVPGLIERRELRVHYQPEFDLRTGSVVGLEALARWDHPVDGLLPAGDWYDIAEEHSDPLALTRLVLADALAAALQIRERLGESAVVGVNLSGADCASDAVVAMVRQGLAAAGLPPAALRVDVSEPAIMADPSRVRATMHSLAELGVGLAVDRFGAGNTSLSVLRGLPITSLRVNLESLGRSPEASTSGAPGVEGLLSAIVSLCEVFDLRCTLVGVENERERRTALEAGFDAAQGYQLGRPCAVVDALAAVRS